MDFLFKEARLLHFAGPEAPKVPEPEKEISAAKGVTESDVARAKAERADGALGKLKDGIINLPKFIGKSPVQAPDTKMPDTEIKPAEPKLPGSGPIDTNPPIEKPVAPAPGVDNRGGLVGGGNTTTINEGGRGGSVGDINNNPVISPVFNINAPSAQEKPVTPELTIEDDNRLVANLYNKFDSKMKQGLADIQRWEEQVRTLDAQSRSPQIQNVTFKQELDSQYRQLLANKPQDMQTLRNQLITDMRTELTEKKSRYDVVSAKGTVMPVFYEHAEFREANYYNRAIDITKLPVGVVVQIETQRKIMDKNPAISMEQVVTNMNNVLDKQKQPYHFEAPPQGWPFPLLRPGSISRA